VTALGRQSFTKKDLYQWISSRHGGYSLAEAQRLTETVLDIMAEGLEKDGKVLISGFGTFYKKDVKKRDVILPDGSLVQSRERSRVWFQPARALKDRVNRTERTELENGGGDD